MQAPSDERRGLPSCSSFPRYKLCPGAWNLEKTITTSEETEEANRGTRIHAWLAGEPVDPPLDGDEQEMADACRKIADTTLAKLLGPPPHEFEECEIRIWFLDPFTLENRASGKFDRFVKSGRTGVLIDYKTGQVEVDAQSSWQMIGLAALLYDADYYDSLGLDTIFVVIVQPLVSHDPVVVAYDKATAAKALEEVNALLNQIRESNTRIPSEAACRYCKARSICPEALGTVSTLATTTLQGSDELEQLDGATMAKLLDNCGLAQKIIVAIQGRAKAMLKADPAAIPGWCIQPGVSREKIVNVQGVWEAISQRGIKAQDFVQACSLTKKNLTSLVRKQLGIKGKALNSSLDEVLAGNIESKPTAPKLCRTDETSEPALEIEDAE